MATERGKAIVTGVAGFIGSHLAERLVSSGFQVVGVDCFTDYYPRVYKEANLATLREVRDFTLVEGDVADLDWTSLLEDVTYVFHQAGQPGVRASWGENFGVYVRNNAVATQRVLEGAKHAPGLKAFVFASSSSVYGDAETVPTPEDVVPRPLSPYGVTKLACEHLCRIYYESSRVPVLTLRYFTAYGPRQRPDMALHRFISAILDDREIVVYGDGEQTRDFTYVSDTVEANILAIEAGAPGEVFNVGGGSPISVNQTIRLLEQVTGRRARVTYSSRQEGDSRHTLADITKAREKLGFKPLVKIEEGVRRQVEWLVGARAGCRS